MTKTADRLRMIGICNTWDVAKLSDTVAWVSYDTRHPHASGHSDRRAAVYFLRDGNRRLREFRRSAWDAPDGGRQLMIGDARAWASEHLGVTDWAPSPLGRNEWVPNDARERALAELKKAMPAIKEKEQRIALVQTLSGRGIGIHQPERFSVGQLEAMVKASDDASA